MNEESMFLVCKALYYILKSVGSGSIAEASIERQLNNFANSIRNGME